MNHSPGLWLVLALCLGFSFLFSGMEAGVFALNRLRVRQRMHAGDPAARLLYGYLQNPEDFLWTILVGNSLANFTAVCLLLVLLHRWLGAHLGWLALAWAVLVFLLYAMGDLLPKMLFRQLPNRLCLRVARPFRFVHLTLSPLVALVAWLAALLLRWTGGRRFTGHLFGTREELRLVMQESGQGLTSEEQTMINRVLDLQTLTVSHLTLPLPQVVTVTLQTSLADTFARCRQTGLSRLPVREREGGE